MARMHRRVLPGELARWYGRLLLPALAVALRGRRRHAPRCPTGSAAPARLAWLRRRRRSRRRPRWPRRRRVRRRMVAAVRPALRCDERPLPRLDRHAGVQPRAHRRARHRVRSGPDVHRLRAASSPTTPRTDGTEAICRRYAAGDARIRYTRHPAPIGGFDEFRFVLDAARAPYFMWLPADDYALPRLLERAVAVLDARARRRRAACRDRVPRRPTAAAGRPTAASRSSARLTENLCRFLYDPRDNSRFYGLYRREVVRRVLPRRGLSRLRLGRLGRHAAGRQALGARRGPARARGQRPTQVHADDRQVVRRAGWPAWCRCCRSRAPLLFGLRVPPRPSTLARLLRLNLVYHVMYCQYRYPRYGQLAYNVAAQCSSVAMGTLWRGLRGARGPGPHDARRATCACCVWRPTRWCRPSAAPPRAPTGWRPRCGRTSAAWTLRCFSSAPAPAATAGGLDVVHIPRPERRTGPRALSGHRAARPPARLPVSDVARGGTGSCSSASPLLFEARATRRPRPLRARRAQRLPGHDRSSPGLAARPRVLSCDATPPGPHGSRRAGRAAAHVIFCSTVDRDRAERLAPGHRRALHHRAELRGHA